MILAMNSNYQPVDGMNLELSRTWVDQSFDGRKRYYRMESSQLSLRERVSRFAIALFTTVITLGLALAFSFVRSQWREALWNKREIIMEASEPFNQRVEAVSHPINSQKLDFSDRQPEIEPEDISNLPKPQELILDTKQAEIASEDLGLSELKSFLYENKPSLSFDSVDQLSNFDQLDLYKSRLQAIPDSIGRLSRLNRLGLVQNDLRTLPSTIGDLSNLQYLELNDNRLQAIPDSAGNLSNLIFLSLYNNSLETIPDSVGNLSGLCFLYLFHNQLRTIPDTIGRLNELRHLYLYRNRLQTIPDSVGNLSNLSDLRLEDNQLQIIPECLYRLPASCTVNLEGNPLSRQAIEQMRARVNNEGYQGPRILFSVHEEHQTHEGHDLSAILREWCDDKCRQSLSEHLTLEQQNNLADWLVRLKETADYRAQGQAIKDKVNALLAWLAEETTLENLQLAHQILADATSSCGDRVALSLNALSLHIKLCKSQHLSLLELKDLIIGSDRYDKLYKIAEQKCMQLRLVDPIEVHLCYQIHLKDALNLPIEAAHMLYEQLSSVTPEDIANARQQILAETGPDQQLSILLENPIWKKALESSDGFAQITQTCEKQKEEDVSQLDTTDLDALQRFEQEFQEKDKTVWDPYYMLTKQTLDK